MDSFATGVLGICGVGGSLLECFSTVERGLLFMQKQVGVHKSTFADEQVTTHQPIPASCGHSTIVHSSLAIARSCCSHTWRQTAACTLLATGRLTASCSPQDDDANFKEILAAVKFVVQILGNAAGKKPGSSKGKSKK